MNDYRARWDKRAYWLDGTPYCRQCVEDESCLGVDEIARARRGEWGGMCAACGKDPAAAMRGGLIWRHYGWREDGTLFGRVEGLGGGGYYFDFCEDIEDILASVTVDRENGDGGLDEREVSEFLLSSLPETAGDRGRRGWGW